MFWLHCNLCYILPTKSNDLQFFVSTCGHVFCSKCIQKGVPIEKCFMCSHAPFSVHIIDNSLKQDVLKYFVPLNQLFERALKSAHQALKFQKMHSNITKKRLCEKLLELHSQLEMQKEDNIEQIRLKNEILKLRKALNLVHGELIRTHRMHNEFKSRASQLTQKLNSREKCLENDISSSATDNPVIISSDYEPLDLSIKKDIARVNDDETCLHETSTQDSGISVTSVGD